MRGTSAADPGRDGHSGATKHPTPSNRQSRVGIRSESATRIRGRGGAAWTIRCAPVASIPDCICDASQPDLRNFEASLLTNTRAQDRASFLIPQDSETLPPTGIDQCQHARRNLFALSQHVWTESHVRFVEVQPADCPSLH